MRWISALLVAVAAMLTVPQAAHAEARGISSVFASAPFAGAPPFDAAPVSDAALADIRGGQSPFARLTVGIAKRMVDDTARSDFRQTGNVGQQLIDTWWGSTGIELIADSVRASRGL